VRSGALPAVKLGGRGVWRVDRRQLETYIERLLEETRAWARANPLIKESEDTNPTGGEDASEESHQDSDGPNPQS